MPKLTWIGSKYDQTAIAADGKVLRVWLVGMRAGLFVWQASINGVPLTPREGLDSPALAKAAVAKAAKGATSGAARPTSAP